MRRRSTCFYVRNGHQPDDEGREAQRRPHSLTSNIPLNSIMDVQGNTPIDAWTINDNNIYLVGSSPEAQHPRLAHTAAAQTSSADDAGLVGDRHNSGGASRPTVTSPRTSPTAC